LATKALAGSGPNLTRASATKRGAGSLGRDSRLTIAFAIVDAGPSAARRHSRSRAEQHHSDARESVMPAPARRRVNFIER